MSALRTFALSALAAVCRAVELNVYPLDVIGKHKMNYFLSDFTK
jgi:hypothetical protein